MSDKDKKQSGNLNEQNKKDGGRIKDGAHERSKTTREEWDKIDKKGHGAGDRPKR